MQSSHMQKKKGFRDGNKVIVLHTNAQVVIRLEIDQQWFNEVGHLTNFTRREN